jgi:hypothetical protein
MTRSIFRRAVAQHRRSEQIFRQQGLPAVGSPEPLPHDWDLNPDRPVACLYCGLPFDDYLNDGGDEPCPARESGK